VTYATRARLAFTRLLVDPDKRGNLVTPPGSGLRIQVGSLRLSRS
jgi:hypothetical protein